MKKEPKIAHLNPWHFFALAIGLSWLFWIPLALLGEEPMDFPFVILMILGGLGPAMAEVILIFGQGSDDQKRDYWHRIFDVRRISVGWCAVIFFDVPGAERHRHSVECASGWGLAGV